jgi:predicted phosphodiesterase
LIVAVLSDIHGNQVSLSAVLQDLERIGPDRVVCLGDVAATGPRPAACVDLLRDLECPVVMGNTDAWLLEPREFHEPTDTQRKIEAIDRWCRGQLGPQRLVFLRGFSETLDVPLGEGKRLFCFHGSPTSFHDPIKPTTPLEELDDYFAGRSAEVFAGGHTHEPMLRCYRDSLILNPGSVGLPIEYLGDGRVRNPPRAEYALVRSSERATEVSLRRVAVELDEVLEQARASDMPHADAWMEGWGRGE